MGHPLSSNTHSCQVTVEALDHSPQSTPTKFRRLAEKDRQDSIAHAIAHLHKGINEKRPWGIVLVESMGLWTAPEEQFRGRRYIYLLEGEAFDWLLLAERLLREVTYAVPKDQQARLLFHGGLPDQVTSTIFQNLLGDDKYQAHLNFFYGVVVEEALILAVEEEVMKEHRVRGLTGFRGIEDIATQRLYGETITILLRHFYQGRTTRRKQSLSLSEWNAFTYWLFKLRLVRSDQSRLASDTRKGLSRLQTLVAERDAARVLDVSIWKQLQLVDSSPALPSAHRRYLPD